MGETSSWRREILRELAEDEMPGVSWLGREVRDGAETLRMKMVLQRF